MALRFFKKDASTAKGEPPSSAAQRASKVDTPSLYAWMDITIMSLGEAFDQWRYKNAPSEEISNCLEALQVIWAELQNRKNK